MPNSRCPPLGIIMLDTDFDRPPGDVGNARSWPFETLFRTVPGAFARKIVGGSDLDILDAFVQAGESLRAEGAIGLTTSCGFLARHQAIMAARLSIPIATSSLMQLPMIERCLPRGQRAGVVTYDELALTDGHFLGVGADPRTPRVGLPATGALRGLIERGEPYDAPTLMGDVMSAVERLLGAHSNIGAIVFECTNLPPFAAAVAQRFRRPVYDIITLGCWFHAGLVRRQFTEAV